MREKEIFPLPGFLWFGLSADSRLLDGSLSKVGEKGR